MASASSTGWPSRARTLRVNQLDAQRLDEEIGSLLRQHFFDSLLWQSSFLDRLHPEFEALLQALLWRYSIWVDQGTPGGLLQNLRFARADGPSVAPEPLHPLQKLSLLGINVILPWLASRVRDLAQFMQDTAIAPGGRLAASGRALARWYLHSCVPSVSALHALCAAGNFLVFLRRGTFSSLALRLLGVQMVHIDPQAKRQVAFDYMNRVMIWNGFSEFLLTVMPLVNLARVRQSLSRLLLPRSLSHSMDTSTEHSCCICGLAPVTVPMRSDCNHLFCYFCIAGEQMEHPGDLVCPRCSSKIKTMHYVQ